MLPNNVTGKAKKAVEGRLLSDAFSGLPPSDLAPTCCFGATEPASGKNCYFISIEPSEVTSRIINSGDTQATRGTTTSGKDSPLP